MSVKMAHDVGSDGDEATRFDATSYQKAMLNILDDSVREAARLQDTQRAVINILEDAGTEKLRVNQLQNAVLNILEDSALEASRLQDMQRAVVNILEDAGTEKLRFERLQKAVLNILEDSVLEAARLQDSQRAVVNILEDAGAEKLRLERLQTAMFNILDDLALERDERKQAQQSLSALNAELDERVRQRTAALERANRELESFAYSISHDLRAPLRAVDGFGRKLEAGYAGVLDDEGRRQLRVMRDNARRMGQLIDDLLAFTHMGRRAMTPAPLDMRAMAQQVAVAVCGAEPRRTIEVVVAALPGATGDPAMLRQVWFNLLANAVKFTRARAAARIEIGGRRDDGQLLYWVRDNGVGFDMQYADKLFVVFQRLHGMDEFEGTGVGLAMSQRIIERHGGRIWAEARLDAGATFYFTLPLEAAGETDDIKKEGADI